MKINAIGQVPPANKGNDRLRYFFNADSEQGVPRWVSPSSDNTFNESPEATVNHYIKQQLGSNFYIRFIYD
jgi:hypothetical protein